jgi:AP-2 complex subunit alpha
MLSQMKGLNAFITDIRGCQNKEQEQNRCEQELSKIKTQFANDRNMTGYHKKKYIWKLLYMYILGYEIDIGHQDAAFLINCPKFSEKYTGYVATSILINEEQSDIFQSISGSIRSDLNSGNEVF